MAQKNKDKPIDSYSAASFSIGLSGVILFFVPVLNFVLQLVAIFLGVVGLLQVQKQKTSGISLAIIGILFGVIGFLLAVLIPDAASFIF